jgi:hypothetical protein
MFASTVSGFADTPVTKWTIYLTVIVPIIISLLEVQYLFDLSMSPHLLLWFQWWRIPLNQLIYTSQSQVLLAVLLLYNLRVIERLMGSRKYLSFMVLVYFITVILRPTTLYALYVMLPSTSSFYFPPGPTSVLFALLGLYYSLVPIVYRFQMSSSGQTGDLKATLSDKTFVYLIAAQLSIIAYIPGSIMSALTGWIIGGLIHSEVIPGKNWRIPFIKFSDSSEYHRNNNGNGNVNNNGSP